MDKYQLAQVFSPRDSGVWALRQGQVVSVQNDHTLTVKVAGSDTEVTGVRYVGYPPPPSSGAWLWSNGTDLFVDSALAEDGNFLAPRVYRTADQAINNASLTPITWQADDGDAYGFWSSGSAITVNVPGRYVAVAQVDFASNATGVRSASIIADNITVGAQRVSAYSGVAHVNVTSLPFTVASTTSVAVWVEQNSSGTLNVLASGSVSPGLGIYPIGA